MAQSMEAAFVEAGLPPRDAALMRALALYRNQGGTKGRATALLEATYERELPGEGQLPVAREGQTASADARQTNGGGEAIGRVPDKGQAQAAAPPPPDAGPEAEGYLPQGQVRNADGPAPNPAAEKANSRMPAKATTRLPNPPRGLEVMRRANRSLPDLGWLGSAKVPNGPNYLDVTVGSAGPMGMRMFREGAEPGFAGYVLLLLNDECRKRGEFEPTTRIGDALPPNVIKRLSDEVEKMRAQIKSEIASRLHVEALREVEARSHAHGG